MKLISLRMPAELQFTILKNNIEIMPLRLFKYCLTFSFMWLITEGYAQTSKEDPVDWQGWYGASITADLPHKWELSLDYQARFFNNLQTYNGSYIGLDAAKKLNNWLELMAGYRISLVSTGTYHRFSLGGEASKDIGAFDLGLRLLLQNRQQDFDEIAKQDDNSTLWRVRLQGKYKINKGLSVYASAEPVMLFGGSRFVDNLRNTAGIKFKVTKSTKMDLFYIYRPDYAKKYNRTFNIIGLNAAYTFKIKKEKDKIITTE